MHDVAAHLADRVLPWVAHRQWVASFPRYVRYQLARDSELLGNVLRGFLHIVFSWQRRRARKQGISDGRCGAVTFIQRFGGFVNLNVHFHALVPDGVFVRDTHGMGGERQRPRFIALDPPTDDEIARLTDRLMRRVAKTLARHHDENAGDDQEMDALAQAQATSVQTTFLPNQTRLHRSELDRTATRPTAKRSAFIAGYSLHANVRIHKNDREGLERLCRYGLRPAFALERLSWTPSGQIEYQFKRPAPSGATRMICAPVDFLAKLATLIPPPRKHLTRYHGVFAPNHPWRPDIVPGAPPDSGAPGKGSQDSSPPVEPTQQHERVPATVLARRLDWAALMLRVFAIDVLQCPRCTGRMRVIALITEPTVIRRVLDHVSMFEDSRAPPAPHADGIDHR
ncbi:MAG: transposase [Nitrospira sp.]|nr:transposase [Nitrospira sp.]